MVEYLRLRTWPRVEMGTSRSGVFPACGIQALPEAPEALLPQLAPAGIAWLRLKLTPD